MDFKSDGEIDLKLYGVVGRNFRGRKAFGRVGNTGFEPNRMHVSAAFGSHRFRVELSSVAGFCVTDQASVTMVARWARMGNTAHPLHTRKGWKNHVGHEPAPIFRDTRVGEVIVGPVESRSRADFAGRC